MIIKESFKVTGNYYVYEFQAHLSKRRVYPQPLQEQDIERITSKCFIVLAIHIYTAIRNIRTVSSFFYTENAD